MGVLATKRRAKKYFAHPKTEQIWATSTHRPPNFVDTSSSHSGRFVSLVVLELAVPPGRIARRIEIGRRPGLRKGREDWR